MLSFTSSLTSTKIPLGIKISPRVRALCNSSNTSLIHALNNISSPKRMPTLATLTPSSIYTMIITSLMAEANTISD